MTQNLKLSEVQKHVEGKTSHERYQSAPLTAVYCCYPLLPTIRYLECRNSPRTNDLEVHPIPETACVPYSQVVLGVGTPERTCNCLPYNNVEWCMRVCACLAIAVYS
eukprot:scaffold858_cov123-Cylindrotheca_fusiformis.AAC.6